MSIAIVGGLDRLKRAYEKMGADMGFDVKFFGQRVPNMSRRISGVDGIVIFTGTVAHPMVVEAVRVARDCRIPLERSHSSGVGGLQRCLTAFAPHKGLQ